MAKESLKRELEKEASKKHLTGDERRRYIGGTITNLRKKGVISYKAEYGKVALPAIKHGKTLAEDKPTKVEIQGYKARGLVAHKTGSMYALTHVKSGITIAHRKLTKDKAKKWVQESAKLLDFRQDADKLYTQKNLPKLKQVSSMEL